MSARSLCLSAYSVPGTVLVGMCIFSSSDQHFEDHSCFRDGNIKTQTICSGCRNCKAVGWDRDQRSPQLQGSKLFQLYPSTTEQLAGGRDQNISQQPTNTGTSWGASPQLSQNSSWSYALKSTSSSGGGWARSRRFIPAVPSLLPDLASGESRRTLPPRLLQPVPTTAGLKNASPAQGTGLDTVHT